MTAVAPPPLEMVIQEKRIPVHLVRSQDFSCFDSLCLKPLNLDRIGIVSDNRVFVLYGRQLVETLTGLGYKVTSVVVEPGESSKSVEVANGIYGRLLEADFSRASVIIALGGGVVGDLAGFVAGTYMRGMRYIQMPTSLLAQVDSSIGGKVGVNHWRAKNLVGMFHQPESIWVDTAFLATLLREEFVNAFGEIIKYALVLDEVIFQGLEPMPSLDAVRTSPAQLDGFIRRCIMAKMRVVQEDERDQGLRRVLNFGHTFGHALEAAAGFSALRHGEAVGWGIIMAQEMGRELGIVEADWVKRCREMVKRFLNLPSLDQLKAREILLLSARDKKNEAGKRFFVFSLGPGSYEFRDDIPVAEVQQTISRFINKT